MGFYLKCLQLVVSPTVSLLRSPTPSPLFHRRNERSFAAKGVAKRKEEEERDFKSEGGERRKGASLRRGRGGEESNEKNVTFSRRACCMEKHCRIAAETLHQKVLTAKHKTFQDLDVYSTN